MCSLKLATFIIKEHELFFGHMKKKVFVMTQKKLFSSQMGDVGNTKI